MESMSTTARNRQWLNAVVLSAVLLAVGCEGRKAPPNDVGAAVDEAAHALIEQPLLHSASIGVVYRGKTFIRHRGEMVAGKPDVPTDATLYEIGSLSKTLAGTLMARAVLEGRVGLEDDVRSYLQGDYPNLQYQGQPIRVRHLLSHTSGLPNMLPERANTVLEDFTDHRVPGELSALDAHYGKPDFLRDLHAVRIPRMPGKEYAYSSAGTELTAHILEGVYKTDYTSLLRGFFSDAAAMTSIGIKLGNAEKTVLPSATTATIRCRPRRCHSCHGALPATSRQQCPTW